MLSNDLGDSIESLVDDPHVRLLDVFPVLRSVADEQIEGSRLDTRSYNALRYRNKGESPTWSTLIDRTMGDLWSITNVGRKSITRMVEAAASKAFEISSVTSRHADAADEASSEEAKLKNIALASDRARFDGALQLLVRWAASERGAIKVGDLLGPSDNLGHLPDAVVSAFETLASLDLDVIGDSRDISVPLSLAREFVEAVGPERSRAIFAERHIHRGSQTTLEEIGRNTGVTRERVRQIASKAESRARAQLHDAKFAPLVWRAQDLAHAIGTLARADSETVLSSLSWASRDLDTPTECDLDDLMLWIAGPIEIRDGWAYQENLSLEDIRARIDQHTGSRPLVESDEVLDVLAEFGITSVADDELVLLLPSWRMLGPDHLIRWSGAIGDKAELVFRLVNKPMSPEELNEYIGEGHAIRSVANALATDPRFIRLDKVNNFGLSEWGLEEYSGIAQEIRERIERSGGEVEVVDLVAEFVDAFGVTAQSVRMYAQSPAFVCEDGVVRLRRPDEPFPVDTNINECMGLYVHGEEVILHVDVDRDTLRGSGSSLAEPASAAFGVTPGRQREFFDSEAGSRIVVSWRETAALGPSLGSIRHSVARLGAGPGDRVRLRFNITKETVAAEAPVMGTLSGLTGLPITSEQIMALATAIGSDEASVRADLQARGDLEVLAMLPVPEASASLQAAMDELGDLLGPV